MVESDWPDQDSLQTNDTSLLLQFLIYSRSLIHLRKVLFNKWRTQHFSVAVHVHTAVRRHYCCATSSCGFGFESDSRQQGPAKQGEPAGRSIDRFILGDLLRSGVPAFLTSSESLCTKFGWCVFSVRYRITSAAAYGGQGERRQHSSTPLYTTAVYSCWIQGQHVHR